VTQTQYIATAQGLAQSLPRWRQAAPLAVDTEFIRTDTFFPKLGLVQLGDGQGEALIDPVAIGDLSALGPVLSRGGPLKILHACSEDLEVLSALAPDGVGEVHDTQIALALLGEGLQVGYQKALQLVLDIDIPKDASRSDWLARPLSQQQRDYAALDVRHLPALYAELKARLAARGLWDIYVAECDESCRLPSPVDPDTAWMDHANAWRLRRGELAVLKALMAWREREAVARDVPRGHLLKPLSAFELARQQPKNVFGLGEIPELSPRVARRDGEQLLALIADARALPADEQPRCLPPPLPREAASVYDALKLALQPVVAATGVPLEVLWRKRLADRLVLAAVDHGLAAAGAVLTGWRAARLREPVLDVLRGHEDSLRAWGDQRRRATL